MSDHDSAHCTLCRDDHWLMTADCVAYALDLKAVTVRLGEAGTGCLRKGRIKQGRNVRYPRAQVEAHMHELKEKGSCRGACLDARKERPLQAVG